MQEYPIPGFSNYVLEVHDDDSLRVRRLEWTSPKGRHFQSGYINCWTVAKGTTYYRLCDEDGKAYYRTPEGLRKIAGAFEYQGLEIPGYSKYRLDRQPDGQWGIRSYQLGKGAIYGMGHFMDGYTVPETGRRSFALIPDHKTKANLQQLAVWVLLAHGPAPTDGRVACHRDGDPTNNEISNLYWGTMQENSDDMLRHGRGTQGSESRMSTLDEETVAWILEQCLVKHVHQNWVAEQVGVTVSAISCIVRGKTWKHVPRPTVPAKASVRLKVPRSMQPQA